MKNTIHIAIALAAVLACGASARAQQYGATTLYTSGTNSIAANATTTVGQAYTATKNGAVALALSFRGAAGNSGNVTARFARSIDGTLYESTPSVSLTAAASGTNTITAATNVTLGAAGYIKLVDIVNGDNTLNTVSVKGAKKPGQ